MHWMFTAKKETEPSSRFIFISCWSVKSNA